MFIMDFLNHDFVHWCWFTCVERLKNHLSTVLLLNAGMSIGMQNRCQSEGVEMLKNPDLYNQRRGSFAKCKARIYFIAKETEFGYLLGFHCEKCHCSALSMKQSSAYVDSKWRTNGHIQRILLSFFPSLEGQGLGQISGESSLQKIYSLFRRNLFELLRFSAGGQGHFLGPLLL